MWMMMHREVEGLSEKLRSVAERSQRGYLKERFCATGMLAFEFELFIGVILDS